MNDTDTIKGINLLAVDAASAVALKDGKLHWSVAISENNAFRGVVDLPKGVRAGDVAALAAGRTVLTIVTKDRRLFVYSLNVKTWIAQTTLFDEARR